MFLTLQRSQESNERGEIASYWDRRNSPGADYPLLGCSLARCGNS